MGARRAQRVACRHRLAGQLVHAPGRMPLIPEVVLVRVGAGRADAGLGRLAGRVQLHQAIARRVAPQVAAEGEMVEPAQLQAAGLAQGGELDRQAGVDCLQVALRPLDPVTGDHRRDHAQVGRTDHQEASCAGLSETLHRGADVRHAAAGQLFQGLLAGEILVLEEIVGGDEDEVQRLAIDRLAVQRGEVGVDLAGEAGMAVGAHPAVVVVRSALGAAHRMVGQLRTKLAGEHLDGGRAVAPAALPVDFAGQCLGAGDALGEHLAGQSLAFAVVRIAVAEGVDLPYRREQRGCVSAGLAGQQDTEEQGGETGAHGWPSQGYSFLLARRRADLKTWLRQAHSRPRQRPVDDGPAARTGRLRAPSAVRACAGSCGRCRRSPAQLPRAAAGRAGRRRSRHR